MCTVTYLPLENNGFILTSNRDENPKRKTISPRKYIEDNVELMYPKDELAEGTWIGVSEKNRIICLLNGGFVKHEKKAGYKKSRGVIVKELLKTDTPVKDIEKLDLSEIEPFTIVLIDWNTYLNVYELVWTGEQKSLIKLEKKPHIWSSSTLYNSEMKKLRKKWFHNWLQQNSNPTQEEIIRFHQNETIGCLETSLKIKRNNTETISTTSVEKKRKAISLNYTDYVSDTISEIRFV